MPLISQSSWHPDLLNAATELLGASEKPARDKARSDIQNIVNEFARILGNASGLPSISDARQQLKTWADKAERLAGSFRTDINSLIFGSATNDPTGNQPRRKKDQRELDDLESEILAAASQLDQIVLTLRKRANRWPKNTGQLPMYQMVHGNPKEPFALACVRVFAVHRPNDVRAGRKGDLYRFLELVYEHASSNEPEGDELLRPLRRAVAEFKRSLPQSQ